MSTRQRSPDEPLQVLDEDGEVVDDDLEPDLDEETLLDMYRAMKRARRFDERAVSLQRQGRMGTYPPMAGQEGAQVGSAFALDPEDWVFPSYREHAVADVRGMPLKKVLQYWMGDERGNLPPEGAKIFPISVPIATQVPHATGAAWASKLKGNDEAFLCYFGDGATSEGDFHEGLNFAGVFDVPAVFLCNNNQWAISIPRERQTASPTLAGKAEAYGFEGIQVDGMDPLAVYAVTRNAILHAKDPGEDRLRPTMIEAVQYRFGAHTTADDPSVYREEAEVERWRSKDPIPRLEAYLRERDLLDDDRIESIESEVEDTIAAAVEAAESETRPHPDDMFDHVYEEPTPRLEEQRAYLRDLRERHGDDPILED